MQAIIRGVCAIIDAFHFKVSDSSTSPAAHGKDKQKQLKGEQQEEPLAEGLEDEAAAIEGTGQQAVTASAHQDIQSALTRRVLPSLRSQLVHDGEVRKLHADAALRFSPVAAQHVT